MKELGWISLHRQIKDHWLWENKPFAFGQAWTHLILSANHEDKEIVFEGKKIIVKRGSFITSILKLSDIFGWDRKKTTRFLDLLEVEKMVTTNRTTHGTTITIVNYSFFQDSSTTNGTTDGITSGTTSGQPVDTNNNDNNDNNNKKENIKRKSISIFIPPTVDEVQKYCVERSNKVNAQQFVDFYSSKDWMIGKNKMKDWKAAVRTWERRKATNVQQEKAVRNNFNNFESRSYDMQSLEKQLLN